MKVFVTGATGYIGGTVAARLQATGHLVTGLTRTEHGAAKLRERGITPLIGSLMDKPLLEEAARRADAVVNAASSDSHEAVEALLPVLEGTGKHFIQTSGSSIIADRAAGEPTDHIYDEETPFTPAPERMARVALDRRIREASTRGVHSIVICPPLIYGQGLGIHEESIQVPLLVSQAKKSGVVRYIGRGQNVWSHVHILDLAYLYLRALESAPAGSFFFAENGEASFREIADEIQRALALPASAEGWSLAEATAEWGEETAVFALGSNSRVRARAARNVLGWQPTKSSLLEDVRRVALLP